MSQPSPGQNPFQASGAAPNAADSGDATGGLIPYKNMYALVAYYLAVFSLIPCIGFFTGVTAFVMGIIGLKKRKANPKIKGSAHAWIGIILGGICALIWGALMGMIVLKGIMEARR